MTNYTAEQHAHESCDLSWPDDGEHSAPLEHWELDDFQDLLD